MRLSGPGQRLQLDLRLVIAGVLALTAGLAVHAVTRPAPTIDAVVAAGPLPPGVPLADLPIATRPLPPDPGLLTIADLDGLSTHRLDAALAPGDPVLRSLLSAPEGAGHDVMGLTLDPAHAVQGALAPGDRIDVYATGIAGTERLASGVLVLDAVVGAGGLGGSDVSLLLAVDADLAAALVAASRSSELDLVRLGR